MSIHHFKKLGRSRNSRNANLFPSNLFVGREQELQELKRGLKNAAAGQNSFFMIEGEPGIGKTRTAQELASYAREIDVCVLLARCYEDKGVPPYWPWIEAIRCYASKHDNRQLRHALGVGAGDIAEIVPEIRQVLPEIEKPVPLPPEEARFRLFDSIKTFIKRAAENKPVLLIIDNLQCADRSSLRILQILMQDLDTSRLMIVGSCRDTTIDRSHPLAETLAELSHHAHFRHIHLESFSQNEVMQFVEGAMGVEPPRDLVRAIHDRTDGNPLFVLEVIRLLIQEQQLQPDSSH